MLKALSLIHIFKGLTIAGILIVVLMLLSVGYDLFYNAGRIVYPMDASAYVFQLSDLPLLASILLLLIYICVVKMCIRDRHT